MNNIDIELYKVLDNGDELIIDKKLKHHLFRNCEELTKDITAISVTSYPNNWWKYRDTNNFEHLFNSDNIEVTTGIKTMNCHVYSNGYWKYASKNGSWNIIDTNGNNITLSIPYIYDCNVYNNGTFDYCISKDDSYILKNISK
jgi:hypothetical protein